ncbi:MAG: thermonuclease family protein [Methylotenera sp.]|nr:thermonuclease family protein [Methylotenera sp.]
MVTKDRMWMRNFCLACLIFSVLSSPCKAEEGRYIITYVYDGDTVKLRPVDANNSQQDFKLRLTDIDAPERNQNYGPKSRRALIKLCQGKNIRVTTQIVAKDKYHRALGRLHCNHTDASLYLAEKGLAWEVNKYSSDVNISHAAVNARKKKLGLWADNNPIPPWDWRRMHPH